MSDLDPTPALDPEPPPPRTGLPRPRHAADVICAGGLILGVIANYVFLAITPKLLKHHVLVLEGFAGSTVAMVTGGAFARVGQLPLWLVVVAPLLPIALYDLLVWWAGRLWGNAILGFYARNSPRLGRRIAQMERLVRRRGVWVLALAYYLPLPTYLVYVACGTSGMPLWLFVIGDAIGTMLWAALMIGLGWEIGHHAVHIVNRVNHYSNVILIAIIVLIVVTSVIRGFRQSGEIDARDPDERPADRAQRS